MPGDKYTAVWVSHSSISDFLVCPRAYYLKNVYKDPTTGHKLQLIAPPLALGQAVHAVVESLSKLPTDQRFDTPLTDRLDDAWKNVAGIKGGFTTDESELHYHRRAEAMLRRVSQNPGPLKNLSVKINLDIPHFWLSDKDNIILCGHIDWLEYLPDTQGVHIIDFKTGTGKERADSLQLPIYHLLATNCQKYTVERASYWYLEQNDSPTPQDLPDLEKSRTDVLAIARKIKLARQLGSFTCPRGSGCPSCLPFEAILAGKAKKVGQGDHRTDIYVLREGLEQETEEMII